MRYAPIRRQRRATERREKGASSFFFLLFLLVFHFLIYPFMENLVAVLRLIKILPRIFERPTVMNTSVGRRGRISWLRAAYDLCIRYDL